MENLIFETAHFTARQAEYRVPGYVIVQAKAAATSVAGLGAEGLADLARCLADAEAVVQRVVGPERIYIMKFGEVNPQVHFHVFPRTERIGAAYAAAVGDKPPYNGARLVEWVWRNHESLGFTDEEIGEFVERAREAFRGM